MSKKITLATCTFNPFWDVFRSINSKAWSKAKVTVEKDVDGDGILRIIFYNEAGDPEQNVLRLLSEQATAAGLAMGFKMAPGFILIPTLLLVKFQSTRLVTLVTPRVMATFRTQTTMVFFNVTRLLLLAILMRIPHTFLLIGLRLLKVICAYKDLCLVLLALIANKPFRVERMHHTRAVPLLIGNL